MKRRKLLTLAGLGTAASFGAPISQLILLSTFHPTLAEGKPTQLLTKLRIFADYSQFYLMDDDEKPEYPSDITELDCSNMAKVAPYIVAVYTARNMTVPVTIRINNADPGANLDEWDHVVECSVDVPSGRLVVIGCTDYLPDARRLEMQPGMYQVRLCYGNLDTLSDNGLDGDDYYVIDLWLGQMQELKVLKQWQNAPYMT